MFLRLSWIVGQAGIGFSSIIVILASVVTIVSALSMSAICTNGEVKGGLLFYPVFICHLLFSVSIAIFLLLIYVYISYHSFF